MSKKVLAVVGSPRKGGNTDALLDVILEGAAGAGAETEKVFLGDLDIKHCVECLKCHTASPKVCAIEDDMHGLAKKMQDADVWVFGTPIFWWGPTGLFKDFMDRWYGFDLGFTEKRIVFAYPSGDPDAHVARFFRGMCEDSLDYMGMKAFAYVPAAGAHDPGDIAKMADVLVRAKQVGADAAS